MSPGFAGSYVAPVGGYDELRDADGALRPHWHRFVTMLDDLGRDELDSRWAQARRLIHDNGVTHNVYGDPRGMDRPWSLDFVPLLITADAWADIDSGLSQRARLLDLILADLYGERRLVEQGLIPPELIFINPGFLRACANIVPTGKRWLHLYAADLGRGRDGNFHVITDRTQAPSGAGYTLENRIVLSRVLPALFRECNVQRLAMFFHTMRQMLASLAPANRENPRIVLLTPGPYNETYFEHAYLARYLGYVLAEGADLTVRDNRVYLKTLGGLQIVDVILRRVDDDFCDPVELRPDSFLGVPGLLEAVREGHVAVANAIGTGAVQAPALLPFLPNLCRALLGEELKLPSVPTWWCGQDRERAYVLEHLHKLVIKPAFPARDSDPVFGERLSKQELSDLSSQIRASPAQFVAQEQMPLSSAPAIRGDKLEPHRLVFRSYLTAVNGSSYSVMPGALTRITGANDSLVVSLQKGGGSKDTWVLAGGPVSKFSLLQPAAIPVELSRGGGDLPSRVADNLFWLGRYVERAEAMVRLARGTLSRLADQTGVEVSAATPVLVKALTARPPGAPPVERPDHDILATIFDANRSGSLRSIVNDIHAIARIVRDRISIDTWRILQTLHQDISRRQQIAKPGATGHDPDHLTEVLDVLNQMVIALAAFGGLAMDSMTRGLAWRFLDMGRRVERTVATARLLRATLVDIIPHEPAVMEAVLEISDSSMTYRRRYLTHLQAHAVVDLLLSDETNPRSAAFQLVAVEEHMQALPRESTHPLKRADGQRTMRLLSTLRLADLRVECEPDAYRRRPRLDAMLKMVIEQLPAISDALGQTYFSHAVASRQVQLAPVVPGREVSL